MQIQAAIKDIGIIQVSGALAGEVSAICYDSRNCVKDSLFVAVSGFKQDGHAFIGDAVGRGARFIVHEKDYSPPPGVTSIRVKDSRAILGILGKNFFRDPSSQVCLIGITGTNGKTTVTYLLEAILKAAGYRAGVIGTVNYRFNDEVWPAPHTTPESYELQKILRTMVDRGVTYVVMEVSSHAVDLRRVDDCSFDMGIFTNLSQDHLDYHKTMEAYFEAKKRFFYEIMPAGKKKYQHRMLVNGDDPWGQRLVREVGPKLTCWTYGMDTRCDVEARDSVFSLEGIKAEISAGGKRFAVTSPLIGKYNLYNILAAVASASVIKIPDRFIRAGIGNLKNVPGRLEKVSGPSEPVVFVDYAHTEDAMQRVLQNLSPFKKGRIITVFGCGGDRDRGKRPLMGKAATAWSDLTVITSDNPRTEDPLSIIAEIEKGVAGGPVTKLTYGELRTKEIEKGYAVIPDRREAIGTAVSLSHASDIVLIAGKGHEDYQIIGEKKFPFDDRKVASEALMNRRKEERH
ncbi:MAG TPA: UDP-N-acetylmuramoyl-L-alanyl-D-glutamate--2,6-diaminopimelate ligase [Syntrophales bacterium]|nr:UDP-N-acetylmuramoyl-L-alanyl-D-glutamate--2,6-diaminopimelate ligase [Syntrophales bacterium]